MIPPSVRVDFRGQSTWTLPPKMGHDPIRNRSLYPCSGVRSPVLWMVWGCNTSASSSRSPSKSVRPGHPNTVDPQKKEDRPPGVWFPTTNPVSTGACQKSRTCRVAVLGILNCMTLFSKSCKVICNVTAVPFLTSTAGELSKSEKKQ